MEIPYRSEAPTDIHRRVDVPLRDQWASVTAGVIMGVEGMKSAMINVIEVNEDRN